MMAKPKKYVNTLVGTRINDILDGKYSMRNIIFGAGGDDNISGGKLSDYIVGGSGNDNIDARSGNDIIFSGSGNDIVNSGSGHDKIYAGTGDDNINAGSGNDSISAGSGDDDIIAGAGNDKIYGGSGNDWINGNSGNDRVYAGFGNDIVYGGSGDDSLYGNSGDDYIEGNSGNDLILGGSGNDYVLAGTGNDRVYGESGNDWILGGSGNDYLHGGFGNDKLYGEVGNDTIYGGDGNDRIDGGDGNDKLYGGNGNDTIYTGAGSVDYAYGGAGNDVVNITSNTAYAYGETGNDVFNIVKAVSYARIDGGANYDTVKFELNYSDFDVALNSNGVFTFTAGKQKLDISNVENFVFANGEALSLSYLTAFYTEKNTKDSFLSRWKEQDALYQENGYYHEDTNKLGIKIAVDYIKYLENGGRALAEVIVKQDGTRAQSLHDNILGNITKAALEDRGLLGYATKLSFLVEQFLDRPWNGGYFNDAEARYKTVAWDYENGVIRNDWNAYRIFQKETSLSTNETKANGDMLNGSGIPSDDFHKVSFIPGGISFSLKADKYGATYNDHVDGTTYNVGQGMSSINANRADWSFYMSVEEGKHGSDMTLGDSTKKGDFDLGIYVDVDPSDTDQFIFVGNLEEFVDSKTSNKDVFQNSFNFNFDFIKDHLPDDYKDDFMGDAAFGIELRLKDLDLNKVVAVNHIDVLL